MNRHAARLLVLLLNLFLAAAAFADGGILVRTDPDGTEYYMDTVFNRQDLDDIFFVQSHSAVGEIKFCFSNSGDGKTLEQRFRTDADFRHETERRAGIPECTYTYLTINDMCVVVATFDAFTDPCILNANSENVRIDRGGLAVYTTPGETYLREYDGMLNSGEHLTFMVTVKNTAAEARAYDSAYFRVDGGEKLFWAGLKLDAGAERKCHIYKVNIDRLSPGRHTFEFYINDALVLSQTQDLPLKTSGSAPAANTPAPAVYSAEVDLKLHYGAFFDQMLGISPSTALSDVCERLNAAFGTDLAPDKNRLYCHPEGKKISGIEVDTVSVKPDGRDWSSFTVRFDPASVTPEKYMALYRALCEKFGFEKRGHMLMHSPTEDYRAPHDLKTLSAAIKTGRRLFISPKWTHTELSYNVNDGAGDGLALTYYLKNITTGFTADHYPEYGAPQATPTPKPAATPMPKPTATPSPEPELSETIISGMSDLALRYNAAMYAMEEEFTFTFADTPEGRRLMERWKTDADLRRSLEFSAGMYSTYCRSYVEPSRTVSVKVNLYYPGVRIAWAWASGDYSFLTDREIQTYYAAQDMTDRVSNTSAGRKDFKKALLDKLYKTVKYDSATFRSKLIDGNFYEHDTAIGALLDHKADCDGFADAYALMLNLRGEWVRFIYMYDPSGKNGAHLANLIPGEEGDREPWYIADACWGKYKMAPAQAKKTYRSRNHSWNEDFFNALSY